MNAYVIAWLLVYTPAVGAQPITVQAITSYEACEKLGEDLKRKKPLPFYGCYAYPMVAAEPQQAKAVPTQ